MRALLAFGALTLLLTGLAVHAKAEVVEVKSKEFVRSLGESNAPCLARLCILARKIHLTTSGGLASVAATSMEPVREAHLANRAQWTERIFLSLNETASWQVLYFEITKQCAYRPVTLLTYRSDQYGDETEICVSQTRQLPCNLAEISGLQSSVTNNLTFTVISTPKMRFNLPGVLAKIALL